MQNTKTEPSPVTNSAKNSQIAIKKQANPSHAVDTPTESPFRHKTSSQQRQQNKQHSPGISASISLSLSPIPTTCNQNQNQTQQDASRVKNSQPSSINIEMNERKIYGDSPANQDNSGIINKYIKFDVYEQDEKLVPSRQANVGYKNSIIHSTLQTGHTGLTANKSQINQVATPSNNKNVQESKVTKQHEYKNNTTINNNSSSNNNKNVNKNSQSNSQQLSYIGNDITFEPLISISIQDQVLCGKKYREMKKLNQINKQTNMQQPHNQQSDQQTKIHVIRKNNAAFTTFGDKSQLEQDYNNNEPKLEFHELAGTNAQENHQKSANTKSKKQLQESILFTLSKSNSNNEKETPNNDNFKNTQQLKKQLFNPPQNKDKEPIKNPPQLQQFPPSSPPVVTSSIAYLQLFQKKWQKIQLKFNKNKINLGPINVQMSKILKIKIFPPQVCQQSKQELKKIDKDKEKSKKNKEKDQSQSLFKRESYKTNFKYNSQIKQLEQQMMQNHRCQNQYYQHPQHPSSLRDDHKLFSRPLQKINLFSSFPSPYTNYPQKKEKQYLYTQIFKQNLMKLTLQSGSVFQFIQKYPTVMLSQPKETYSFSTLPTPETPGINANLERMPLPYITFSKIIMKKLKGLYPGIRATQYTVPQFPVRTVISGGSQLPKFPLINFPLSRSPSSQSQPKSPLSPGSPLSGGNRPPKTFIHGTIFKKSQIQGKWERRYIIINEKGLFSFKNENEEEYSYNIQAKSIKYMWTWFTVLRSQGKDNNKQFGRNGTCKQQKVSKGFVKQFADQLKNSQKPTKSYSPKSHIDPQQMSHIGQQSGSNIHSHLIIKIKHNLNTQTQFAIPICAYQNESNMNRNWLFGFYRMLGHEHTN